MKGRGKPFTLHWKRWRTLALLVGVMCAGLLLEGRILYLQVLEKDPLF